MKFVNVNTPRTVAQVLPFDDNLCVREPCLNFEHCLTVLKFGNASGFVSSDSVLFRPIYPVSTFACRCPTGFTGQCLCSLITTIFCSLAFKREILLLVPYMLIRLVTVNLFLPNLSGENHVG